MAARQRGPGADPDVMSVSEVTRQIKDSLEGNFPDVWVQGEISNLKRASSGHLYFTLKDSQAQLTAILWRSGAARLRIDLHDGLEVIAAGAVEVGPFCQIFLKTTAGWSDMERVPTIFLKGSLHSATLRCVGIRHELFASARTATLGDWFELGGAGAGG